MSQSTVHALLMILICSGVTMGLRALPFLVFRKGHPLPPLLQQLSDALPPAIIAVLVVYCLKAMPTQDIELNLKVLAAAAMTVAIHRWRHQTVLSIFTGTAVYMILLHL